MTTADKRAVPERRARRPTTFQQTSTLLAATRAITILLALLAAFICFEDSTCLFDHRSTPDQGLSVARPKPDQNLATSRAQSRLVETPEKPSSLTTACALAGNSMPRTIALSPQTPCSTLAGVHQPRVSHAAPRRIAGCCTTSNSSAKAPVLAGIIQPRHGTSSELTPSLPGPPPVRTVRSSSLWQASDTRTLRRETFSRQRSARQHYLHWHIPAHSSARRPMRQHWHRPRRGSGAPIEPHSLNPTLPSAEDLAAELAPNSTTTLGNFPSSGTTSNPSLTRIYEPGLEDLPESSTSRTRRLQMSPTNSSCLARARRDFPTSHAVQPVRLSEALSAETLEELRRNQISSSSTRPTDQPASGLPAPAHGAFQNGEQAWLDPQLRNCSMVQVPSEWLGIAESGTYLIPHSAVDRLGSDPAEHPSLALISQTPALRQSLLWYPGEPMAVRQGPTYILMPTEPVTPPDSSPPSSSDEESETEDDPLAEPLPFICPTPFCEDRVFCLDGRLRCRTCRTQGLHLWDSRPQGQRSCRNWGCPGWFVANENDAAESDSQCYACQHSIPAFMCSSPGCVGRVSTMPPSVPTTSGALTSGWPCARCSANMGPFPPFWRREFWPPGHSHYPDPDRWWRESGRPTHAHAPSRQRTPHYRRRPHPPPAPRHAHYPCRTRIRSADQLRPVRSLRLANVHTPTQAIPALEAAAAALEYFCKCFRLVIFLVGLTYPGPLLPLMAATSPLQEFDRSKGGYNPYSLYGGDNTRRTWPRDEYKRRPPIVALRAAHQKEQKKHYARRTASYLRTHLAATYPVYRSCVSFWGWAIIGAWSSQDISATLPDLLVRGTLGLLALLPLSKVASASASKLQLAYAQDITCALSLVGFLALLYGPAVQHSLSQWTHALLGCISNQASNTWTVLPTITTGAVFAGLGGFLLPTKRTGTHVGRSVAAVAFVLCLLPDLPTTDTMPAQALEAATHQAATFTLQGLAAAVTPLLGSLRSLGGTLTPFGHAASLLNASLLLPCTHNFLAHLPYGVETQDAVSTLSNPTLPLQLWSAPFTLGHAFLHQQRELREERQDQNLRWAIRRAFDQIMGSPPCSLYPQPLELPGDDPAQFQPAVDAPTVLTPHPTPACACTGCGLDSPNSDTNLHQETSCACQVCGNPAVNTRDGAILCSCCLDLSDANAQRCDPPDITIDARILTDYSDSGVAGAPGVEPEDIAAGITKFACESLPDVESLDVHGCLGFGSFAESLWADSTKANSTYARAVSQGLKQRGLETSTATVNEALMLRFVASQAADGRHMIPPELYTDAQVKSWFSRHTARGDDGSAAGTGIALPPSGLSIEEMPTFKPLTDHAATPPRIRKMMTSLQGAYIATLLRVAPYVAPIADDDQGDDAGEGSSSSAHLLTTHAPSHPEGLMTLHTLGGSKPGQYRSSLPRSRSADPVPVPHEIENVFGSVIAEHTASPPPAEADSGPAPIVQRLLLVTGLHRNSDPSDPLLELTPFSDPDDSSFLAASNFFNLVDVSTREEALKLGEQNLISYALVRVPSLNHYLDTYEYASGFKTIRAFSTHLSTDPDIVTPSRAPGPPTGASQRSSARAPRALFQYDHAAVSAAETADLREAISGHMRMVTDDISPYKQVDATGTPWHVNLQSKSLLKGSVHPPHSTMRDMLDQNRTERENLTFDKVASAPFCYQCLCRAVTKVPEAARTPDKIRQHIVDLCTTVKDARFCDKCPSVKGSMQPLHPPLDRPTNCTNCGHFVHPRGQILTGCVVCKLNYIDPLTAEGASVLADQKDKFKPKPSFQMSDSDCNAKLYVSSYGGLAKHMNRAQSCLETQERLMQRAETQSSESEGLPFGLTLRHIAFGSRFLFGEHGHNATTGKPVQGLCLRDFQTTDPSPLYRLTAPQIIEKALRSDPPEWNLKMGPGNPQIDDATCAAQVYSALHNMMHFILYVYGIKYDEDCNVFKAQMHKLRSTAAKRVRYNHVELERVINLCLYEWCRRIRESCEDLSLELRYDVEMQDPTGGNCIRLVYTPQLPSLAEREAAIHDRIYTRAAQECAADGTFARDGRLATNRPTPPPPAPKKITPPNSANAKPPGAPAKAGAKVQPKRPSPGASGDAGQPSDVAPAPNAARPKPSDVAPAPNDPRKDIPCVYWEKNGSCLRAANCFYFHDPTKEKPSKGASGEVPSDPTPAVAAVSSKKRKSARIRLSRVKDANPSEDCGDAGASGIAPVPAPAGDIDSRRPDEEATEIFASFCDNYTHQPSKRALSRTLARTDQGIPPCPEFNSKMGCTKYACSLAHVSWRHWSPAWALRLWDLGGAKDWKLETRLIDALPGTTEPSRDPKKLHKRLTQALGRCVKANETVLDLRPLIERRRVIVEEPIYQNTPIPTTTRGGLAVNNYVQVAFGAGNSVIQGISMCVGDKITNAAGQCMDKQCVLRAAVAQLPPPKRAPSDVDSPYPALLEEEIREQLLNIPALDLNPTGLTASLYFTHAMSNLGSVDLLFYLCDPQLLRRYNILHLVELDGVGSAHYYPSSTNGFPSTHLPADRLNDPSRYDKVAAQNETITLLTRATGNTRHTTSFETVSGKLTHASIINMLKRWAEDPKGIQVSVIGRGNWKACDALPSNRQTALTPDMMRTAQDKLFARLKPPPLPEGSASGAPAQSSPLSTGLDPYTGTALEKAKMTEPDKERLHAYDFSVYPPLSRAPSASVQNCESAMSPFRRFCDDWFLAEYLGSTASPKLRARDALLSMTKKWRAWHYDGNAGAYDPDDATSTWLEELLDSNHYRAWKASTTVGFTPLVSGTRRKFAADNHPSASDASLKILQDFLKQCIAKKCFLFSSDNLRIRGLLLEAGVLLNPLGAVPKVNSDGTPQIGEDGEPKYRPIVDGTAGGHTRAPNSSAFSFSHPVQITTTLTRMLRAIFRMEASYPHAVLRQEKKDVSDAFRHVSYHLDDIGTYAYEYGGFINVTHVLVFGATSSPSAWEVYSSAIEKAFDHTSNKERTSNAATERTVDDFWLLVALVMDGHPSPASNRLAQCIRNVCGPTAINEEKGMSLVSASNVFGTIIDLDQRTASPPWSKILKLCYIVQGFVTGKVTKLSTRDAHSAHGLCRWVCRTKSALVPLMYTRLAALLSSSADPSLTASPALKGESAAEGWNVLRDTLHLVMRVLLRDRGSILTVPFEEALPMGHRLTFPGKETPDALRLFQMDASGTGLFVFCDTTGQYCRFDYTPAEQALFNAFDDEHGTNIALRELMAATYGACVLAAQPNVNHERRILDFASDNQNVVGWLEGAAPSTPQAAQLVALLSLAKLIGNFEIRTRYVTTDDNVLADAGTRHDKDQLFQQKLEEWSSAHQGQRTVEVPVPPALRELGWSGENLQQSEGFSPLPVCLRMIQYWQTIGGMTQLSRERLEEWRTDVQAVVDGEPPPPIAPFDHDLKQVLGPSSIRRALCKLTSTRNTIRTFLEKKFGPSKSSDEIELAVIHRMQQQRAQACAGLAVHNVNHDPAATSAALNKLCQTYVAHKRGLRVFEGFAGQGSLAKAFNDQGLGQLVGFSERCPVLRSYLQRLHPSARAFSDHRALTAADLRTLNPDVFCCGPTCIDYSTANSSAKGTAGKHGKLYFESVEPAIEARIPVLLVECTSGVRQAGTNSTPSALSLLKARLEDNYDVRDAVVLTPSTRSRHSGMCSPVHHQRTYVVAALKGHPTGKGIASFPLPGQGPPIFTRADHILLGCEPSYMVMPPADQHDVLPCFDRKGSQALRGTLACVAKAASYPDLQDKTTPHAMASGSFPDLAYSLHDGLMPTCTSSGGVRWVMCSFNNRPCFRLVSVLEMAGAYGLRSLDRAWLEYDSEIGLSAIGNSIPQPVADEWAAAVSQLFHPSADHGTSGNCSDAWLELDVEGVSGMPPNGRASAEKPTATPFICPSCRMHVLHCRKDADCHNHLCPVCQQHPAHCHRYDACVAAAGGKGPTANAALCHGCKAPAHHCTHGSHCPPPCRCCSNHPALCARRANLRPSTSRGGQSNDEPPSVPTSRTSPLAIPVNTCTTCGHLPAVCACSASLSRTPVALAPPATTTPVRDSMAGTFPPTPEVDSTTYEALPPPGDPFYDPVVPPGGLAIALPAALTARPASNHLDRPGPIPDQSSPAGPHLSSAKEDSPTVIIHPDQATPLDTPAAVNCATSCVHCHGSPPLLVERTDPDPTPLTVSRAARTRTAVWCLDCLGKLPYSEVSATCNVLVERPSEISQRLGYRKYCYLCKGVFDPPVLGRQAFCDHCTPTYLRNLLRQTTDTPPDALCTWCHQSTCQGCHPCCPDCSATAPSHRDHCRLAPPWTHPRGDSADRHIPLHERTTTPCPCLVTGAREEDHYDHCPKRQERLFVSSDGPHLLIDPLEARHYVAQLKADRVPKTLHLLDQVAKGRRHALVPRKVWLNATEGYSFPLSHNWCFVDVNLQRAGIDQDATRLPSFDSANPHRAQDRKRIMQHLATSVFPRARAGSRYQRADEAPDLHRKVGDFVSSVLTHGPPSTSAEGYDRDWAAYEEYCVANGREPYEHNGATAEFEQSLLFFLGWDASIFGNRAGTLSRRIGTIKKMHILRGLKDPTADCFLVKAFLDSLTKLQPRPKPKFPYPAVLLAHMLKRLASPDAAHARNNFCLRAACALGFNFFLRSCEYVKVPRPPGEDSPVFKWRHVSFTRADDMSAGWVDDTPGNPSSVVAVRRQLSGADVANANHLTIHITSTKNDYVSATRTNNRTGTAICAVTCLIDLYLVILKQTGKVPDPNSPVFLLENGSPLTRETINAELINNADAFGLPRQLFTSHSLRRGGAAAHLAAGGSASDVQFAGRWKSADFRGTYGHLEINALAKSIWAAQVQLAQFERN